MAPLLQRLRKRAEADISRRIVRLFYVSVNSRVRVSDRILVIAHERPYPRCSFVASITTFFAKPLHSCEA
jgi:hypothetical protein